VVIGIISASAIITNWTLGALISWKRLPRLRALKVIAITGVTMLGLSVIQKAIFPNATLVLDRNASVERKLQLRSVAAKDLRGVSGILAACRRPAISGYKAHLQERSEILHRARAVASSVPIGTTFRPSLHPLSSVRVALAGWLLLIGLGAWAWWHQLTQPFLGWALLAQFSLFLVFGTETILYAPSWLPYLLALIVFAAAFWPRRFILPVLAVVVACMVAHNARTFAVAADMVVHPESYPDLMYHLDRSIPPVETP
jgi:hypothetical protein